MFNEVPPHSWCVSSIRAIILLNNFRSCLFLLRLWWNRTFNCSVAVAVCFVFVRCVFFWFCLLAFNVMCKSFEALNDFCKFYLFFLVFKSFLLWFALAFILRVSLFFLFRFVCFSYFVFCFFFLFVQFSFTFTYHRPMRIWLKKFMWFLCLSRTLKSQIFRK